MLTSKLYTILGWHVDGVRAYSKVGKVSVVHHDHLKVSQIPFGNGQVVPLIPESDDIQVVQNVPEPRPKRGDEENGEVARHIQPRVREALLRQNVRPPVRYGYDKDIPSKRCVLSFRGRKK